MDTIGTFKAFHRALQAFDLDTAAELAYELEKHTETFPAMARASFSLARRDYRETLRRLEECEHLEGMERIEAMTLRAMAQIHIQDFDGAWKSCEAIAAVDPKNEALKTLRAMAASIANQSGKRFGDYSISLDAVIKDPATPVVRAAVVQFEQGRMEAGNAIILEAITRNPGSVTAFERTIPQWDGRPVSNLTVIGVMGLGDQIQYARFIRYARALASHITLAIPRQLMRLFADVGADRIVLDCGYGCVKDADAYISCFWDLPALLRRHDYGDTPYLQAAATLEPSRALQVGLCWASSPLGSERAASLPDFDQLRTMRRIEWHSLVPGAGADWMRIHHPEDFADTAGIVAGLDLVITVDTSVAHVAGAMGKRVWLLLPTHADWRWGKDEYSTPWYSSARLFRRRTGESWHDLMKRVRTMLEAKSQGLLEAKRRPAADAMCTALDQAAA
ncbi:glycosyltransferase family 9 protein [Aromatoleum evansii]|uniref:glycosyltransferase family 9 protein n=1 Tax=Aromatoleum evansii TaxID=59406 RepID=UPI00145C8604|nr:hypothetical protein [Aromatoleum evansii]NMG32361.1 hypothetical protein [Aromatoleum evansii]